MIQRQKVCPVWKQCDEGGIDTVEKETKTNGNEFDLSSCLAFSLRGLATIFRIFHGRGSQQQWKPYAYSRQKCRIRTIKRGAKQVP